MDIVGNGFLARNLRPLADAHPDTVVLAAGVSSASGTSPEAFAREAALLGEVAARCRATGRRLLFFSTASTGMYGAGDGPGTEDRPVVPCTPYGAHKLALEERLRDSGADHLVLRLSHVVGPGQPPHQLLPGLVRQLREGTVAIHRGAARDLIGVAEVVTLVDRLLALGLRGQTVNVASGTAVPVTAVVDHLERNLGLTAHREYHDAPGHATAGFAISTAKLHCLLPETTLLGFGPAYYRRVLDAFTGHRAAPSAV
ncbi:NAD-dependent epimerase/dehydratase family protein [Streptomyces sp. NPDC026206]|uniref:NAD-dependent epimerase/dehydratase family protein n=1 Tax=Streptomyces sp. NPDC026206 TaxID=3157089 RepID=UPI0034031795